MATRMPSRRRTCGDERCRSHRWPVRKGPHLRAESITPTPGDVRAAVFRSWDDDGNRAVFLLVWDSAAQCWSERLPLPARPRKPYVDAVRRARQFVRTGVLP